MSMLTFASRLPTSEIQRPSATGRGTERLTTIGQAAGCLGWGCRSSFSLVIEQRLENTHISTVKTYSNIMPPTAVRVA